MNISGVVAELAALNSESFGLAAERAQKQQRDLGEKRDQLRAERDAIDRRLDVVDLRLSAEEAKKNWYRGDVHGFLFGEEDLETPYEQQKLHIRADELEARLEIVRKDITRVGQSLGKRATVASSLERTLDGAVDGERQAKKDGARIGGVAETDGVAEVQVQQDQVAAEIGAVSRRVGDRADGQVEAQLLHANKLRDQFAKNEHQRGIFNQVVRTLGGGLFSQVGQLLRKVGLPAELGILAGPPKALGTFFFTGIASFPNSEWTNDNLDLSVAAERSELQQTNAEDLSARMERLAERADATHEKSRKLGQQLQDNLRRAQFG